MKPAAVITVTLDESVIYSLAQRNLINAKNNDRTISFCK